MNLNVKYKMIKLSENKTSRTPLGLDEEFLDLTPKIMIP